MNNSEQIIFKFSNINPKILKYFEHFENFINHFYSRYDDFFMIQTFQTGFLWIFRDLIHFRQSIQIFKELRNNASQELLEMFYHQFTEDFIQNFDIQPEEQITFIVELSNNIPNNVLPMLKDYFTFLSQGIHFRPLEKENYLWIFDTPYHFVIFFGMVHFLDQYKH